MGSPMMVFENQRRLSRIPRLREQVISVKHGAINSIKQAAQFGRRAELITLFSAPAEDSD
jgi:hypothetical protein